MHLRYTFLHHLQLSVENCSVPKVHKNIAFIGTHQYILNVPHMIAEAVQYFLSAPSRWAAEKCSPRQSFSCLPPLVHTCVCLVVHCECSVRGETSWTRFPSSISTSCPFFPATNRMERCGNAPTTSRLPPPPLLNLLRAKIWGKYCLEIVLMMARGLEKGGRGRRRVLVRKSESGSQTSMHYLWRNESMNYEWLFLDSLQHPFCERGVVL